jgi:hypothetical protein
LVVLLQFLIFQFCIPLMFNNAWVWDSVTCISRNKNYWQSCNTRGKLEWVPRLPAGRRDLVCPLDSTKTWRDLTRLFTLDWLLSDSATTRQVGALQLRLGKPHLDRLEHRRPCVRQRTHLLPFRVRVPGGKVWRLGGVARFRCNARWRSGPLHRLPWILLSPNPTAKGLAESEISFIGKLYKLETKKMFEIRHLFSISQSLDCHYNFIHNLIFSYLRFGDTFQGQSSFLF